MPLLFDDNSSAFCGAVTVMSEPARRTELVILHIRLAAGVTPADLSLGWLGYYHPTEEQKVYREHRS